MVGNVDHDARMILGRQMHVPIKIAGLVQMSVLRRRAPGRNAAARIVPNDRQRVTPPQDLDRKTGAVRQTPQLFVEARIGVRGDGFPGGVQRRVGIALRIGRLRQLQSGLNELDRVAFGQFSQLLPHLVGRTAHDDERNLVVVAADARQKPVATHHSD